MWLTAQYNIAIAQMYVKLWTGIESSVLQIVVQHTYVTVANS